MRDKLAALTQSRPLFLPIMWISNFLTDACLCSFNAPQFNLIHHFVALHNLFMAQASTSLARVPMGTRGISPYCCCCRCSCGGGCVAATALGSHRGRRWTATCLPSAS